MLRSKKLFVLLLVAGLLCSTVLWAGGGKEAKAVKIGALVPLTGALSEFGQGFRLAGDLAAEKGSQESVIATDIIEYIGKAYRILQNPVKQNGNFGKPGMYDLFN